MHVRYDGPVIDAHCHYDATTVADFPRVARAGGLLAAIQLWDVAWPPAPFPALARSATSDSPTLLQCHVPDLSAVGSRRFEESVVSSARIAAARGAVGFKVWKNVGLWEHDVTGRLLSLNDKR